MGTDGPAEYEIRVQGRLSEDWTDWFGGMEMTVGTDGDGKPVTTLIGRVLDQPALQGILTRVASLNLPLISVKRIREIEE